MKVSVQCTCGILEPWKSLISTVKLIRHLDQFFRVLGQCLLKKVPNGAGRLYLLFHKHLLMTYFMQDCVPGTGDTKMNEIKLFLSRNLPVLTTSYNSYKRSYDSPILVYIQNGFR